MTRIRLGKTALRTAVASVIAATLLSGCGGGGGRVASANDSAPRAESSGSVARSITRAEADVAKDPRNGAVRATLGHAYLKAGRFTSASTSFEEAMQLGDNSARSALGLALSYVATGNNGKAVAILDDWRDIIPASDLGLALALAGEPSRGVALLSDSLRNGDNTPKLRQNLAYAYALDGRWREARLMMEQDVPADQIDQRISDWAGQSRPEDHQKRIASLLNVPVIANDAGQPAGLALANTPSAEQLATEASGVITPSTPSASSELPAVGDPSQPPAAAPIPVPAAPAVAEAAPDAPASGEFATAFSGQSLGQMSGENFISQPVVQQVSVAAEAQAAPATASAAPVRRAAANGSHLIQLGSFSSPQGARRAWGIFAARSPELRNFRMVITPAVVRGKNFWRVAAAGFDSGSARGMCSSVRTRGGVCFAYAASRAPAGAVPSRPFQDRGNTGPQRARRR